MKLLISTPCSGGLLHETYVGSLITSANRAREEGIITHWEVHFQGKESLIHRARNRAALYALEQGFDRLLTIDADISWDYEHFKRVLNTAHPIVGGTYPIKAFPIRLNFIPLDEQAREFMTEGVLTPEVFYALTNKYADQEGLLEVKSLPTGFLSVSCEVFSRLSDTAEVYFTGDAITGLTKGFFDFYPSRIINKTLESEDWGFCRLAREAGFKLHLDTKVILPHTGNHAFCFGQKLTYGESVSG